MSELQFFRRKTNDLIKAFGEGGFQSFISFRNFISSILHLTIAKKTAVIQMYYFKERQNEAAVGGAPAVEAPIVLNDGKFLRVTFQLALDPNKKLTVLKSSFQYQLESEKTSKWIFRYDYSRNPLNDYPASHLQINANLREAAVHRDCPDIHFPTNRIALEAVIRLLVEQFNVKCNEPKHWRNVLALSERSFNEGAFRPLSGPE